MAPPKKFTENYFRRVFFAPIAISALLLLLPLQLGPLLEMDWRSILYISLGVVE